MYLAACKTLFGHASNAAKYNLLRLDKSREMILRDWQAYSTSAVKFFAIVHNCVPFSK